MRPGGADVCFESRHAHAPGHRREEPRDAPAGPEKLRRDPALLERARANLRRWLVTVSPRSRPYLEEWDRVLSAGVDAAASLAVEDSARAATLRQCSPFAGLLTPRERFAFLKAWRAEHAA